MSDDDFSALPGRRDAQELLEEARQERDEDALEDLRRHLARGWTPPEDVARAGWRECGLLLLEGGLPDSATVELARALLRIGVRGEDPARALGLKRGHGGSRVADPERALWRRIDQAARARDLNEQGYPWEVAFGRVADELGVSESTVRDAWRWYRRGVRKARETAIRRR
ncbi:MAG TPA: hypothetical protein VMV46_16385 [Thermoanaerobaculia bacterium]|nr:hypothetical protein [Thermoanaerobaculia bacterium]